MIVRPVANGFRAAFRRPGLVLLVWAWYTTLALVVTLPAWSRLRAATAARPETDVLLHGLQLGTLIELLQQETAVVPTLVATVMALACVALLSNAFVSGGILEVLLAGDEHPLLHRFFRGAGHFLSRSLRLLVLACVTAFVVCGLVTFGMVTALRPLANGSERGLVLSNLLLAVLVGFAAGVVFLALDYARVVLVREDGRGMLRAWLRGLRFVLVHPLATGVVGFGFFGLVLVLAALGAWLPTLIGAASWPAILTAAVIQQVCVGAWIALRIAQLAAQADLYDLATPVPAPEPEPAPAPPVLEHAEV